VNDDYFLIYLNTSHFHVTDTACETELLLNVAQILKFHLRVVESIYLAWHLNVT